MNQQLDFSPICKLTHAYALLCSLLLSVVSCGEETDPGNPVPPLIQTPREAYLSVLDNNGLAKTQMVRSWSEAGLNALEDSVLITAPFLETGYFRAAEPAAIAYRIELKAGERLEFELQSEPDSTLFFVDLFRIVSNEIALDYRYLFSAENYQTDSLSYEVQDGGIYLLRIQPELLASCRYTLQLVVQPVYGTFPVSGKGNGDIWSFFGDPRDGGKRSHKGIDIFARRGTPVVAATDARVRRVRNRGLGGKQVWLFDEERRQSLYYAHLDSQLVVEGQLVRAGDTVGLIGNTGNARYTRPHLHFSIYRRGYGAIDPHPFVAFQTAELPNVRADTSRLGQLVRIRLPNSRLRKAPESRAAILATLNRYLPLQVMGASQSWYRVRSPEGLSGYVPTNAVEDIDLPIRKLTLAEAVELLVAPHPLATPVSAVQQDEELSVLGQGGEYQLVRSRSGDLGWIGLSGK